MKLKSSQVVDYINKMNRGRIFSVKFTKKDGTERVMNVKKKHLASLAGGEYKGKNPNVMPVYSLDSKGWRSFDVTRTKEIHMNGEVIEVEQDSEQDD